MNNYSEHLVKINEVINENYDFLIVGSGMGGSVAAYALCKKGYKVLLIEKGGANFSYQNKNDFDVSIEDPEARLLNNRWPSKITTIIDKFETQSFLPLGCGIGGSTGLYAGALERLEPVDFQTQQLPSGDEINWPYTYDDIEPYYKSAEKIFNVHGINAHDSDDFTTHLMPPKDLSNSDNYLFNLFKESGLNPYRLHIALSKSNQSSDKDNYMSAMEACIFPALDTGKLSILENTEVIELIAESDKITSVRVTCKNQDYLIPLEKLILAAGAYFTPIILLKSRSTHWPSGIGNQNDLVGRNLMFHATDFIGINCPYHSDGDAPQKSIGIRDFYTHKNDKLGQIQSFGLTAQYGYILHFLRNQLESSFWNKIPLVRKIIYQMLRIPAWIATKIFKNTSLFVSVLEDFPYHHNRVKYDENKLGGISIIYDIPNDLKRRLKKLRSLVRGTIKTRWMVFFNNDLMLNYGHPCGTCRAGNDPSKSVIDSNCKFHYINNLFITDASFMPTSGGTNPSLTIAANALRVVDNIVKSDNNFSKSP